MRIRRVFTPWYTGAAALVVALPLLAVTAASPGSAAGAAPPSSAALNALPLFTPVTVAASAQTDTTDRFGEAHVAVNPTNPNNLVATYNQDGYTFSCVAAAQNDPTSPCVLYTAKLAGAPFLQFPEPQAEFATGVNTPGPPKWSTCGVFVSDDRGVTWKHVTDVLPGSPAAHHELKDQGDCTVAAGPDGSFYIGFDDLNWNDPNYALPTCGIGIDKSSDGGMTWTGAVLSGTGCDGPKVTTDLSDGRIYEASTSPLGSRASADPTQGFATTPTDRYLVSSTDGVTWTTPEPYGGFDGATFHAAVGGLGQPVSNMSAANGTLAVAFVSNNSAACNFFVGTANPCLVFQHTTDAGASWSRHSVPGAVSTLRGNFVLAADPSAPGHYTLAGTNSSNQFVTYQTSDYGMTWSGPGATVVDPNSFSKFHAWMAYSPTGVLGLTWSARTKSGNNTPYNIYAAISFDGGATWVSGSPFQVGASAAPSAVTPFMPASDDYSNITLRDDAAFVTWSEWPSNGGDRAGYFSAIRFFDYDFAGFLPPINNDGSSVFNAGRTIPVKFQLSVKGHNVFWASATLTIDHNANPVGTFRYDPTSQQYIFNASTKGLSAGTHTFTVTLDDGTTHSVNVTLT